MSDFLRLVPLAWRAIQHRDKILYLINLLMPTIKEAMSVRHEAASLVRELIAEIAPDFEQVIADKVLVQFDVAWLQRSLNTLISAKLVVDGDYGEQTRTAVRLYQKHAGFAAKDQDGWAGTETCAAIWAELNRSKKHAT